MSKHLIGISANGLASLAPQVSALLLLDSEEFGLFSLAYLVFALGMSGILSLVAEPWVRMAGGPRVNALAKRNYFQAAATVSILFGAIAGFVCLLLPELRSAVPAAVLAVGLAVFRIASRFFQVRADGVIRASFSDFLITIGIGLGISLGLLLPGGANASTIFWAWALGGGLGLLAGGGMGVPSLRGFRDWGGEHATIIRPLLKDSLMNDVGAVGGSYLLAPVLGIAQFGVYRAISNVGAPVRLILNPLRPVISSRPASVVLSAKVAVVVGLASAALAVLMAAVVALIPHLGFSVGVIGELGAFAVPVGLYIFGNAFGQYFYICARYFAQTSVLVRARALQTLVVVCLPLAGAYLIGLEGAVWAQAIVQLFASVVWPVAVMIGARRADRE